MKEYDKFVPCLRIHCDDIMFRLKDLPEYGDIELSKKDLIEIRDRCAHYINGNDAIMDSYWIIIDDTIRDFIDKK
jgi:hypothetical protein